MKEKTCCFTGHRNIPEWEAAPVKTRLHLTVRRLILQGYCYFGTGGALGFDTMAAQTVLLLQKEFPHIKLILVLPCTSQADRWQDTDKRIYEEIKRQADKIGYVSEMYTRDCMFRRNRHLVDYSSGCVCYLKRQTGGTAYTVGYALENGLWIENMATDRAGGYAIGSFL